MRYEKPNLKVQIFTVEDFLINSSLDEDDEPGLPGDPDNEHEVFPDAFGDALSNIFDL